MIRNDPSSPAVAAPAVDVPESARIVAPDRGADVVLSTTRPAIVPVCARAVAAVTNSKHRNRLIERGVILTSVDWSGVRGSHGARRCAGASQAVGGLPHGAVAVRVL